MRNRKITKYGNANVIRLKPIDMQDLNLKTGDMVNIDKIRKQKTNNDSSSCCDMTDNDAEVNQKENKK